MILFCVFFFKLLTEMTGWHYQETLEEPIAIFWELFLPPLLANPPHLGRNMPTSMAPTSVSGDQDL